MPLSMGMRHTVGESLPQYQDLFGKSNELSTLIQRLNDDLHREGFSFQLSNDVVREGGFRRVYISKLGHGQASDLFGAFLDIRLGTESPGGRTIEMASSKENTYGIPGHTRILPVSGGKFEIGSTLETFKDFLRSSYTKAKKSRKPVQQVFWNIYAREEASDEDETSYEENYPGMGVVLRPSSPPGDRWYHGAKTILVPEKGEKSYATQERLIKWLKSGQGVKGLEGYIPEEQKGIFAPGAKYYWETTTAGGARQIQIEHARKPEQVLKSRTLIHESRSVADIPLVAKREKGRMYFEPLEAGSVSQHTPTKTGWTELGGYLPGEETKRKVLMRNVLFTTLSDLSGAALVSKSAYKTRHKGYLDEIYAMGEAGNVEMDFALSNMSQLEALLDKKSSLQMYPNIKGRKIRSGPGKFKAGKYTDEEGNVTSILVDRKEGYDFTPTEKPRLFIPKYYDPDDPDRPFSNVPKFDDKGPATTDLLVKKLQKKFGKYLDIVPYSTKGVGTEDSPAEVHMAMPMARIVPSGLKMMGSKAGQIESPQERFQVGLLTGETTSAHIINPELKMLSRTLMSTFLAQGTETRKDFLEFFLGDSRQKQDMFDYIDRTDPSELELDSLADIWSKGKGSAEEMFSIIGEKMLRVNEQKKADYLYKKFGIGIVKSGFIATTQYSESQKAEFERYMQEQPELRDTIKFAEVKGGPGSRKLYQKYEKVRRGASIVIPVGLIHTAEYPFVGEYIGPKAITSLMENYPETARAMGIMDEEGNWKGPLSGDNTKSSSFGWFGMHAWGSMQSDLSKRGVLSVPANNVPLTPDLARAIVTMISVAKSEKTSQQQLESLSEQLASLSVEDKYIDNLATSYFYDHVSASLIPPIEDVLDVESFEGGLKEGQQRTFIGSQYMRYLESVSRSILEKEEHVIHEQVKMPRQKFLSRITNALFPGGKRAKNVFRNIYGLTLPGTRGGRYQGLTQLEMGEAYASDDYIRSMLRSGGYKDEEEIKEIMNWMNTGDDAYLPILTQRYPDVSREGLFLPMKLRSKKWLNRQGVLVPEGMTSRDTFFMSALSNRLFVGDFDFDPASQILLPIEKSGEAWRAKGKSLEEFEKQYKHFEKGGDLLLAGMFGKAGTSTKSDSLDVTRKVLQDYLEAVGKGIDESPLRKRASAYGKISVATMIDYATDVQGFKGGMGAAYNRRTLTEDIMEAVLDQAKEDKGIFEKAYESGGYMYQLYLDRLDKVRGGYSSIETMLQTAGIYTKQSPYSFSFKIATQGDTDVSGEGKEWVQLAYNDPESVLQTLTHWSVRNMGDKMSNAMLSWGWGGYGKKTNVYNALEQGVLTGKDRTEILRKLVKSGDIGTDSPFYASVAFSAVKRFIKNNPGEPLDKYRIPWIDGNVKSLSEIVETDEYRLMSAAEGLVIGGHEPIGAQELQKLEELQGKGYGPIFRGIAQAFREKTGGLSKGEQGYISALERAQEYILSLVSTTPPEVHASELGSLVGEAGESVADREFRAKYQTWPTGFKLVARHLGMPEIMQGAERDYYGDFFFKEREFTGSKLGEKLEKQGIYWKTGKEAQQAGNRFEAAFASKYEKELYHIGKTEHPLRYELGGLGIVGTPDFIGYDDQTDSMRIVDTKLAQADPYHEEYGLDIRKRTFSFKNQVQQMAYAYGFERMAKETTESEWLSKMQEMTGHLKSKAPDEVTLIRMRKAALAGKFDIQLQPGTNEGSYQEYKPYQVFYGDVQRAGVEEVAEKIYGSWFEPKAFKRAAGLLYQSLSEGAMPNAISAAYTFGGREFDPKEYKKLEQFVRAAGGFSGNLSGKRVRVGESGPEDIYIDKGQVKIIPTSQLPENRRMRGEGQGNVGYTDSRFSGGFISNIPDDFEIGKTSPVQMDITEQQIQFGTISGQSGTQQAAPAIDVATLANAFKDAIGTLKIAGSSYGGNRRQPSTMRLDANIDVGAIAFKSLMKSSEEYERNIRSVMENALQEAGIDFDPKLGTSQLVQKALELQVPYTDWMPKLVRSGVFENAPIMSRQTDALLKAVSSWQQIVKSDQEAGVANYIAGEGGKPLDPTLRQMIESVNPNSPEYQNLEQVSALSQSFRDFSQQPEVRRMIKGGGKLEGIPSSVIEEYGKALEDLTKKTNALTDETGGLFSAFRREREHTEAVLRKEEAESKMAIAGLQYTAGRKLVVGGQKVSPEVAAGLYDTGEVTRGEYEAYTQIGAEEQKAAGVRERILRSQKGGDLAALGRIGRRALGGWGLMYLQTIGKEILGATSLGYEEMLNAQAMGSQAMGMVAPGQPFQNPELARQQAMLAFGGGGARSLRMAETTFMKEHPVAYQAGKAAWGGLMGAAGTMWFMNMMGPAAEALVGPVAIGAAGAVAGASLGIDLWGATQDKWGSAVAASSRITAGKGFGFEQLPEWARAPKRTFGIPGMPKMPGVYPVMGVDLVNQALNAGFSGLSWTYENITRPLLKGGPGIFFDPVKYATARDEEIGEMTGVLTKMSEARYKGEDINTALSGVDKKEWGRYKAALAAMLPKGIAEGIYSPEATATAAVLQERYKLSLPDEKFEELMQAVQAGVPVDKLMSGFLDLAGTSPLQKAAGYQEAQEYIMKRYREGGGSIDRLRSSMDRQASLGVFGQVPFEYLPTRLEKLEGMSDLGFAAYESAHKVYESKLIAGINVTGPPAESPYRGDINGRQAGALLFRSNMEATRINTQASIGMNLAQSLLKSGWDSGNAELMAKAFAQMGIPGGFGENISATMYQGMLNRNPLYWGQWAQQQPGPAFEFAQGSMRGIGGTQISPLGLFMTDVTAGGQMTGMNWGRSSLGTSNPYWDAQRMSNKIFGDTSKYSSYQQGIIETLTTQGTRGWEMQQLQEAAAYQQQMSGISMAKLQLQMQYQPQFWAIEDQQRALEIEHQRWQFGFQERQLEQGNRQFMENFGLTKRQTTMTRGFAQQGWEYQDTVRDLQWGWKQEDYAESVRFMTGRDRRLAERQMGRETILHGLEGDQIQKQRSQQQEMWKLEDQRYQLQLKHHQESLKMQEEQLQKSRQYFEERTKLETKMIELQRKYWKENMQLSLQAEQAQVAYAKKSQEANEIILMLTQAQEKMNAEMNLFNEESLGDMLSLLKATDGPFKNYLANLKDQIVLQGGTVPDLPSDKKSKTGSGGGAKKQFGGLMFAGSSYIVGEAGIEEVTPLQHSMVRSNWETTVYNPGDSKQSAPTTPGKIVIYIGGRLFQEFIIDSVNKEINL